MLGRDRGGFPGGGWRVNSRAASGDPEVPAFTHPHQLGTRICSFRACLQPPGLRPRGGRE